MLYIDCDETILFNGIINLPVLNPAREFTIKHADKIEQFLERFRELVEEETFKPYVKKLIHDFTKYGPIDEFISKF